MKDTFSDMDWFILGCIVLEKTNYEIAQMTNYSLGAIKYRLSALYRRFNVKSRAGLAKEIARKHKIRQFLRSGLTA